MYSNLACILLFQVQNIKMKLMNEIFNFCISILWSAKNSVSNKAMIWLLEALHLGWYHIRWVFVNKWRVFVNKRGNSSLGKIFLVNYLIKLFCNSFQFIIAFMKPVYNLLFLLGKHRTHDKLWTRFINAIWNWNELQILYIS